MLATTKGTFTCIDRDFKTDVDMHEVFCISVADGLVQETSARTFAEVLVQNPARVGWVAVDRAGNVSSSTGYSSVKRVYLIEEGLICVFLGANTTSGLYKQRGANPMNVDWIQMTPLGYYATYNSRTLASLPESYTVVGERVFEYYPHNATPFAAAKVCMSGPEIIGLFGVKTGSTLPLFVPTQKKGFWGLARRWAYRTAVSESERFLGIVFSSGVKAKADTFIRMAKAGLVPTEATWAKNFETPVSESISTPGKPCFVIRCMNEWPNRTAGNSNYPAVVTALLFDGHLQGQGIISILNGWNFEVPEAEGRALVAANCSYLLTSDADLDAILGQFDDVYRKLYQETVDGLNALQESSVRDIQKTLAAERPLRTFTLDVPVPSRESSGKLGKSGCWMGALTGGCLSEDSVIGHKPYGMWSVDWTQFGPKSYNPGVGISAASQNLVNVIGGCMPIALDDEGNERYDDGQAVIDTAEFDRAKFERRLLASKNAVTDVVKGLPSGILKWCFSNLENLAGQKPDCRMSWSYDHEYTSWFKTKVEHTVHLNQGASLSISDMLKNGTKATGMVAVSDIQKRQVALEEGRAVSVGHTGSDNIAYRFLLEGVQLFDKGITGGKRRFDVALDLDSYLFECAPNCMPASALSEFYKGFWEAAVGVRDGFAASDAVSTRSSFVINAGKYQLTCETAPEVTLLGVGRFVRPEDNKGCYGNFFKGGVRGGYGVAGWHDGNWSSWDNAYDAARSRRVRLCFKDLSFDEVIPTAKVVDGECNMFKWVERKVGSVVTVVPATATDLAHELTSDVTARALTWLVMRLAEYGDLSNLKAFGRTGNTYLTPQLTAMLTEFGMDAEGLQKMRDSVQKLLDGNIPKEDGDGNLTGSQKWIDAGREVAFTLPDGMSLEQFRTGVQLALDELDDFVYEGGKPWYVEESSLGRCKGVFDASTIPYYGLY